MYDNQVLLPNYSSATFINVNQSKIFNSSRYPMQGIAKNANWIHYYEQAMQHQREYHTKLLQENYPDKQGACTQKVTQHRA